MNSKPRNPPEHSGDCAYYPIPSTGVGRLDRTGKTAAVVGAGPGGLTAALTIKEEGYENVIVFEKRSVFSRMNVVNLHPESLHIFERLNIMDRFLERASLIIDHRNRVFVNGMGLFNFRDQGYGVDVNPEHSFNVDDVINGFRNETLYSISLADLQDLLATIACERGIKIVSPAHARLVPGRDGIHSVWAAVGDSQGSAVIDAPELILIAEGAKGEVCRALGGKYSERESLWPDESWVFGNYKCDPDYAFSHLLFEFRGDCEHLTISNCIFLPLRKEVNVAVTVSNPEIPGWYIKDIIATQAAKILDVSGVRCSENRVVWHSNQPVRITPKTADCCHFGRNVVLLGDAMGANSPVAALGGTLSTSAYSYAIRHLVRDLEAFDAEVALARYGARAQSCVNRWHNKVTEVRRAVDLEIRHKTKQLVAVSSTRRESSVVSGAL